MISPDIAALSGPCSRHRSSPPEGDDDLIVGPASEQLFNTSYVGRATRVGSTGLPGGLYRRGVGLEGSPPVRDRAFSRAQVGHDGE